MYLGSGSLAKRRHWISTGLTYSLMNAAVQKTCTEAVWLMVLIFYCTVEPMKQEPAEDVPLLASLPVYSQMPHLLDLCVEGSRPGQPHKQVVQGNHTNRQYTSWLLLKLWFGGNCKDTAIQRSSMKSCIGIAKAQPPSGDSKCVAFYCTDVYWDQMFTLF